VDEEEGRKAVLGKNGVDKGQILDYQCYRTGFRKIASNTNERTLIATIIPPIFHAENFQSILLCNSAISHPPNYKQCLYLVGIWNSFLVDWYERRGSDLQHRVVRRQLRRTNPAGWWQGCQRLWSV
ncbi:MAG: hypothetical protein ACKPA7_10520, partial [Sphaerospermopsis kisseleviana]